jgi:hypothetical protein
MAFYDGKVLEAKDGVHDLYEFKYVRSASHFWSFINEGKHKLSHFGLNAKIEIPVEPYLKVIVNSQYEMVDTNKTKIILQAGLDSDNIHIRLEDGSIINPVLINELRDKSYKILIDLDTTDNLSDTEMHDIFEEFLSQKEIKEKFEKFINSAYTGLTRECEISNFELLDISENNE